VQAVSFPCRIGGSQVQTQIHRATIQTKCSHYTAPRVAAHVRRGVPDDGDRRRHRRGRRAARAAGSPGRCLPVIGGDAEAGIEASWTSVEDARRPDRC